MLLTTRGRYAVTAMVDITAHQQSGPVSLNQIADNQNLSLSYLEQLFAQLRQAGLVIGLRGPGGGYKLAHPAESITVAQVVHAVNENVDATQCGGMKNCSGGQRCLTHGLWDRLSQQLYEFLDDISLGELVQWPSVIEVIERQELMLNNAVSNQHVALEI